MIIPGVVEAGGNKHVQQAAVERVCAYLERSFLRVVHDLAVKNPPGGAHETGHVVTRVVQQAALKAALHDGLVIVHKGLRDGRNHAPHGRGAQHAGAPAVRIHGIKARVVQALGVEQRRHGLLEVGVGDDAQLARVFHIDDAVADVVCRLQQVRKRMPAPATAAGKAHLAKNFGKQRPLCRVKVKLALAHALRLVGRARVFHQGGNNRECQPKAAAILVVFKSVDNPKSLRVAVKSRKIGPFRRLQVFEILLLVGGILEPVANGLFARMPKGRVADIVGKAGGLYDLPKVVGRIVCRQIAALAQGSAHTKTQRPPNAAYLQRMGKAVVDMIVAHQRVHLRFSCQPAKRAGKYDAVVIRQKRIAPFYQRIKLYARTGFAVGGQQQCPLLHECAHNASSSACTACVPRPQAPAPDAFLLLLALLVLRHVFTLPFRQKHGGNKLCSKARHDELAF